MLQAKLSKTWIATRVTYMPVIVVSVCIASSAISSATKGRSTRYDHASNLIQDCSVAEEKAAAKPAVNVMSITQMQPRVLMQVRCSD